MGSFKEKDRACRNCGARWKNHEEKETDVNLALALYREAARDRFDLALVVSQDSDLGPAIKMVRSDFPMKRFRILTPIGLHHSYELTQAAGGRQTAREMKRIHLERALLLSEVWDAARTVIIRRPPEYAPPGS